MDFPEDSRRNIIMTLVKALLDHGFVNISIQEEQKSVLEEQKSVLVERLIVFLFDVDHVCT